jgi:multiple sugar transport system substrate-binding protein
LLAVKHPGGLRQAKEGMMNRRVWLQRSVGWTCLAAGAAVAACGPSGRAPASDAGAPATVRWPSGSTPLDIQFADEFNKRFNAKYGPKITAVAEPYPAASNKEIYEKWTTMAVAGDLPEILALCCTWIRPFMLQGVVLDLNPYMRRDWKPADFDDFYKSPVDSMKIEGKQLGLPGSINIMNIMFVNRNHLREAGLPYPSENWTKQQFLDYVLKLNRPGGERWGYDMPFHWLDRNVTWIWNTGGEPHDPKDGPVVTRLTYDDPKTIEGLQFLHDLIWKHQVSPVTNEQRGGLTMTQGFVNGKSSIYFNASGDAGPISTDAGSTGLDWDFLPLVKGPTGHGARHSLDGWLIAKQTKIADAAWTFLRELLSTEGQALRAQLQRRQPVRRSASAAWEQVYPGKNAKLARIMAETARPDPRAFWKDANEVGPIVENKYMQPMFQLNEWPVPEAMRRCMAEVRAFYAAKK